MFALGAAELKCAAELESLLFMRVRARQRGGDTSHRAGGGGAVPLGDEPPVCAIWSRWASASTAGMRSFVMMFLFMAFKM